MPVMGKPIDQSLPPEPAITPTGGTPGPVPAPDAADPMKNIRGYVRPAAQAAKKANAPVLDARIAALNTAKSALAGTDQQARITKRLARANKQQAKPPVPAVTTPPVSNAGGAAPVPAMAPNPGGTPILPPVDNTGKKVGGY